MFRNILKKGVTHTFNTEKKLLVESSSGTEFMKECGLSMRNSESTSVAWLMTFNRVNVGNFFELLRYVMLYYSFTSEQIYNFDETGFFTVATITQNVLFLEKNMLSSP